MADKKISKVIFGGETLIDLTEDTVTADALKKGITAHAKNGEPIVGEYETKLQSKSATPTKSAQTIKPDSGYDGLSQVSVDAIPSDYIIPSGTKTITEAGSWGKLKSGKGWISLNSCYVQRITSQATSSVIKGDLNGDGKVTAADARIALQIAAGLQKPTAEQLKAGDIDGNGKIGANDARAILRMAAGLK